MLGMTLSVRRELEVVVVLQRDPIAAPADADLEGGRPLLDEDGERLEASEVLPVDGPRCDVDRERQRARGRDHMQRVHRVLQLRVAGRDRLLLVREGSSADYHLDI